MRSKSSLTKGATNAAIIAVGSIAGRYVAGMEMIPENIRAFVPLALGLGAQMSKNPMLQLAGQGMIAGAIPPVLATLGVEIPQLAGSGYLEPVMGYSSIGNALPLNVYDTDSYLQTLSDESGFTEMQSSGSGISGNGPITM
jgi:hypothetical protein